ncbi:MAG: DEAD/DEAH box helicase [Nitriliruptorales bacterium]
MEAQRTGRRGAFDPRQVLELVAHTADELDRRDDPAKVGSPRLVHLERLPARPGRLVAIPEDLPSVLRSRLELFGVERLYSHQARCLELVRSGRHVIVATGTASGKSLCYQLPVLGTIVSDPKSTALYLAPTKALARDQLRTLRAWRLPQLRAAALDGDTPRPERDAIRRTANLVLTNPDLVHHTLLADHARWADLLHRLAFVVVDECHVARGVFGAHVALVLRRLRRLCERYGATPTFLLASATVGNPREHAMALTGLSSMEAVVEDGAPRGALEVGLWQPPLLDEEAGLRRSTLSESGELLAAFVAAGVQTLVFTKSRRAAEVVALVARERLGSSPAQGAAALDDESLAETVAAYRAGYLPEERRALEQALSDGNLLGLASTEALELGIDVGGLDAVVLVGYPGRAASFWQRMGRAGRSGQAATGVLVADDDPLDQYLVNHPAELLGRPPEDVIVDPTNPYILAPHLRCACQEQPLDDDEAARWFGADAPGLLALDVDSGVLRRRGGRHFWVGRGRAAAQVDIRSAGGRNFRIVDIETGALVGDVDEARAYRQVHEGAVYLHQGRVYEVVNLDRSRVVAAVREAPELTHTTRARSTTHVDVLEVLEAEDWGEVAVRLGRVQVTDQVTGYDVVDPSSRRVLERIGLDLPPTRLGTVAVWYVIPFGLLESVGLSSRRLPGSLHAAEHAAIGLLPLVALCDRWDVGGLSTPLHPDTGSPTVFVYDGYPGGAGLAERSYRRLPAHLEATRQAIAGCRCRTGCPSCVHSPKCGNGNEPLDKAGALVLLGLLLERAPA